MMMGMALSMVARLATGAAAAPSPMTSVAADGWQATYPSPPASFNPVSAPQTLSVTRPGFTTAATATTVAEQVTIMARVRQPFPAQASLTADKVVLSDFVYAADTLPAGVTNLSALAYPRPIACWLTPDLERAQGSSFTARLAVAHAYARNRQPVAAVTFIASDGSNTVQQTISAQSSRQWGSGLYAPYFECAIPLATLNQGALCTLDVIIYPWVGAAWQASVSGAAYPSINFTVLKFLNDRTGGYGQAYAYVNATTGNNGTALVSATPSPAAAAPYLTVAAAAAAIRTFNTTTYARSNASGGTIRLVAGEHVHATFQSVTVGEIPLLIEAENSTLKSTTIYKDSGTTALNSTPFKLKFRNLTLKKVGAAVTMLDNSATLATLDRMLVLENVAIDRNGTSSYGAWIYRTGRCWMIDVSSATTLGPMLDDFAGVCKEIIAIGCSGPFAGTNIFNAVACKFTGGLRRVPSGAAVEPGAGQMFSHSHITQNVDGSRALTSSTGSIDARGFAVVGCVLEQTAGETAPNFSFHADSDVQAVENALCIGTTVVGSRTNWLYQDTGTATVAKRGFIRFSALRQRNTKTDVFGTNANLVGNWPASYNVGARANAVIRGSNDGNSVPGVGRWLGEAAALGDAYGSLAAPLAVNWVSDQSFDGGAAGNGDYTPGAGTALPFIPAGMAPYSIDMKGRAVANDGSARIGAIMV